MSPTDEQVEAAANAMHALGSYASVFERARAALTAALACPAEGDARAALLIGREAVVESFDHAANLDDTYLAEARLHDIDQALAGSAPTPPTLSVQDRAWEFTQGAFKSFDLPDDRLREYSAIIAELIQGAVDEAISVTLTPYTSRPAQAEDGEEWRADIENAPKDGRDVLFPIKMVGRAYWCTDLKRWVLAYPLHMEYVSHPTKFRLPRFQRDAAPVDIK